MKKIRFLKGQFDEIQDNAQKEAKQRGLEVCGLILNNGYFYELIQLRNKTKRGGSFSFYFNEVNTIRKMEALCKHEIVGAFHSHPVGLPSPGHSDLHYAVNDSIMLIYDVLGNSARLWHIKNEKPSALKFSLI